MNPGRFYMPNSMGMQNIPLNPSMVRMATSTPRNIGLFTRITNGLRSINWGGLLNNAHRTLDVVNQTIPLIRQAKPMVSNMKSMLRIAKAFGSETNTNNMRTKNNNQLENNRVNNINNNYKSENSTQKKEVQDDSTPNFFV